MNIKRIIGWGSVLGMAVSVWTVGHAVDFSSLATNQWVQVTGVSYTGAPNGGSYGPSTNATNTRALFDPVTARVIVYQHWDDPVRGLSGGYPNGLIAFDPASNVATVLKLSNWGSSGALDSNATDPTPTNRYPAGNFVLSPDFNKVYLGDSGAYANWWSYDLVSRQWSLVSDNDAHGPHPTQADSYRSSSSIYDPANKALVTFITGTSSMTTTWVYKPAGGGWNRLPLDPSASLRAQAPDIGDAISNSGMAYDSKRGRIVVLGGAKRDGYIPRGSPYTWAYSVSLNKWTRLADYPALSGSPGPVFPGFDYDSKHDIFLACYWGITRVYNPQSDSWTSFSGESNGCTSRIAYDPVHDVFVSQGGNPDNPTWWVFRYAPPAGPYATGTIGGQITSAENGTGLSGVLMELRDTQGKAVQTTRTTAGGSYTFLGLPGSEYVVSPVVKTGQQSTPEPQAVVVTYGANFSVRGTPAEITISGETPGTFVMISTYPYTAEAPPVRDRNVGGLSTVYGGHVGSNRQAVIRVLSNPTYPYYMTCWKAPEGVGAIYTKTGNAQLPPDSPGRTINPLESIPLSGSLSCPG